MIKKLNRKKVDKQEDGMPTNIEQLIEKYSLEELWKYIDKCIDSANEDIEGRVLTETKVQNNIDANDCVKSGFYYLGSGCSNVPGNYVRIITNGSSITNTPVAQIAIEMSSKTIYVRTKYNTVWSNWIKLPINNYSTTEIVSGIWTNGKPLYRRVFTGTADTSSAYTTIITAANFTNRKVVNFSGYVVKSNGVRYPISSFTSSSGERVFPYQGSSNNIQLYVSDYDSNTYDYVLIVEYTKTTD